MNKINPIKGAGAASQARKTHQTIAQRQMQPDKSLSVNKKSLDKRSVAKDLRISTKAAQEILQLLELKKDVSAEKFIAAIKQFSTKSHHKIQKLPDFIIRFLFKLGLVKSEALFRLFPTKAKDRERVIILKSLLENNIVTDSKIFLLASSIPKNATLAEIKGKISSYKTVPNIKKELRNMLPPIIAKNKGELFELVQFLKSKNFYEASKLTHLHKLFSPVIIASVEDVKKMVEALFTHGYRNVERLEKLVENEKFILGEKRDRYDSSLKQIRAPMTPNQMIAAIHSIHQEEKK